jgi:alpha-tubulin suppressor-like RCC1 family protein
MRAGRICLSVLIGMAGSLAAAGHASGATPVTVSIGDLTVVEGDGGSRSVQLPVTLSDPRPNSVAVSFVVVPGSADAGSDFAARPSGSVTFKAGTAIRTLSVQILGDTAVEGDETFSVSLTSAGGGVVLGRSTGTVTIGDDDPTAGLELGIGDLTVVEGDTGSARKVRMPVTASTSPTSDLTVAYVVGAGSATRGDDFTARTSGTVTIRAGALVGRVTLSILPDADPEPAESVVIALSGPSEGMLTRSVGTVTIVDDENLPITNLYAWGRNLEGQFGNGTMTSVHFPVPAAPGFDWIRVSAGGTHACGIRSNGTLWCWGRNDFGQLGDGTTTDRPSPVQVGTRSDWTAVAAGGSHTCGIRAGGTLWCWGLNWDGQLGNGSNASSTVPVREGTHGTWTAVAAGSAHTCGLRGAGTLWCWGQNEFGRLGDGTTTDRNLPVREGTRESWTAVAAGSGHSCGLRADGRLWCWGLNGSGQLGDGYGGSSWWGPAYTPLPSQVSGDHTDWIAVTGGGAHTCGIRGAGTLWCWGANGSGQLGDGSAALRLTPVPVVGADWTHVSAGGSHTCALRASGTLWCWGNNTFGQLGDGTYIASFVPVQEVGATAGWNAVAAGSDYALALR